MVVRVYVSIISRGEIFRPLLGRESEKVAHYLGG